VLIFNDGSIDDTLGNLIEAFNLEKTQFEFRPEISTKPVKEIYKSGNRSYAKLTVIDKENGGKADALNAGIDIASLEILAYIDVECILSHDVTSKMVSPFIEETNKKVTGIGVAIGIANTVT